MHGFFDRNCIAQTKQLPDTSVQRRIKIYEKALWIKVIDIFFLFKKGFSIQFEMLQFVWRFSVSSRDFFLLYLFIIFHVEQFNSSRDIYDRNHTKFDFMAKFGFRLLKTTKKEDLKNYAKRKPAEMLPMKTCEFPTLQSENKLFIACGWNLKNCWAYFCE